MNSFDLFSCGTVKECEEVGKLFHGKEVRKEKQIPTSSAKKQNDVSTAKKQKKSKIIDIYYNG